MSSHSRRAIGPIDGLLLITLATVWGGGFLFVLMPISALLLGVRSSMSRSRRGSSAAWG